ncbi:hypothetical protein ACOI1C_22040, partial [Bacillus sp. DJP31]|uniref:hypothetical protein n=1 Tax=Bacillus sp. DJP31 TaxID=3409789 RepID=UPI003BB6C7B5
DGGWGKIAISFGYDHLAQHRQRYSLQGTFDILNQAVEELGTTRLTMSEYNEWAKDKDVPRASNIANRLGRGLWKKTLEKARNNRNLITSK